MNEKGVPEKSVNEKSGRFVPILLSIFVGVIAIAVRVPSCDESFWVDELHSTWCVWGSFGDVAPRASLGNQSPLWFWLLWVWKQGAGESELALRMISVLATAGSSLSLCYCLARKFHPTSGLLAGMVLALETNSIFFGTELRPYAMVVLLATLACCCLLIRDRSVFPVTLLTTAAVWIQPTSIAVMLGLLVIAVVQQRSTREGLTRVDYAWLGLAGLSIACVASSVLMQSWEVRDRWSSFAVAPGFYSAMGIWSWLWLWLLPLAMIALTWRAQPRVLFALAGGCVVVVLAFWLASRIDFVHLWHRRYFIGLLPVFASLVGCSVVLPRRWMGWAWLPASVLLVGLMHSQGTLKVLAAHPGHLAYRGEDWRGAIAKLRALSESSRVSSTASTGHVVLIDAGLIEAQDYVDEIGGLDRERLSESMREYLVCVARGPYQLGDVESVPAIDPHVVEGDLILRGRPDANQVRGAGGVFYFGTVTVVER